MLSFLLRSILGLRGRAITFILRRFDSLTDTESSFGNYGRSLKSVAFSAGCSPNHVRGHKKDLKARTETRNSVCCHDSDGVIL